jgi:hypothetical protein
MLKLSPPCSSPAAQPASSSRCPPPLPISPEYLVPTKAGRAVPDSPTEMPRPADFESRSARVSWPRRALRGTRASRCSGAATKRRTDVRGALAAHTGSFRSITGEARAGSKARLSGCEVSDPIAPRSALGGARASAVLARRGGGRARSRSPGRSIQRARARISRWCESAAELVAQFAHERRFG